MVGKAVTKRAHDITVRSIRLPSPSFYRREAARRREEAQLSVITNAGRFGDLIAAAGVLLLLDAAFLPALFKEPCTAQRLIDALNDLRMQLRTKAHAVGGGFEVQASAISDLIHAYYTCTPLQKPEWSMRLGIVNITNRVKALLDDVVTIGV
nr:unnamed protein product [Digitaria exilis]